MRTLFRICVIALISGAAPPLMSAQRQAGSNLLKPSVQMTSLEYRYPNPRSLRSIRDVDFRNLRLVTFDATGKPDDQFALHNGRLKRRGALGSDDVDIGETYYFTAHHDTNERVLVEFSWLSCGGSCSDAAYLLVFEVRRGNLHKIQQITYDMQAPGTLDKFYPDTRVLIVLGRTSDDSPHCCPRSLDEVTFDWDGKAFQVKSLQRLLIEKSG